MTDARMTGGQGRRVLFIDLQRPEPDRHASSLRASQLLTLLRDWQWQVDFLALVNTEPPGSTAVLDRLGVRLLPWLPTGAAEDFVAAEAAGYDLIYVAWTHAARRMLEPARRAAPAVPLIFDTHDVNHRREFREARISGNARTLARALVTKQNELAAVRRADVVLAITPADRDYLRDLVPEARIHTVEMWTEPQAVERAPEPALLLFVGNMGAPHNHDCVRYLATEVMPLLRQALPGATLLVAGQDVHPSLRELAAPDIVFAGWVPDLAPLLRRATLFLAPLRFGSGLKGKMLQAMACGLPIVASDIAAEGMPLVDGEDYLRVADPAGTVAAVRRLIADPGEGRRLAAHARATLARHYTRPAVEAQFSAALRAALEMPRVAGRSSLK